MANELNYISIRIRKEADEIASTLKETAASVKTTFSNGSYKSIPRRINEPSGINPIKMRRFFIAILKLLIVFEFVAALGEGLSGSWERLGRDCILAGILSIAWDRITSYVLAKKDAYRLRVEQAHGEITLMDATIFSLLWSDEIYTDIPEDQRRLAVIAYTLIAIGIGALYFGSDLSLLRLILSASIVLAAVNLLAWVVSRERGERESLQTELKLAHDVQVALMPKEHPKLAGFDIAGLSIPAKEVGGDHFDYALMAHDTKFAISVFDVSGKGMQAAMSAVFTTGLFAGEIRSAVGGSSAAEILTRLNKPIWAHRQRGHFVAFLLAIIDLQERTLTFANAGQMKPLLKSNGAIQWLDSIGASFPLGMKEDSEYCERTVQLHTGDTLLLLTDGFTEAMNAEREQFGTERIEHSVRELDSSLSSQRMLERIKADVASHVGSAIQHDDMTMVVIRVLAKP
jgi:serine phosphatase RsbU (regulator of sigma subunit)